MSTVQMRQGPGGRPRQLVAGRRRGWWVEHLPELAFAALLALGAGIVLYETRGLSLYFDDWEFVLHRRGLAAAVLLRPHGPHLSLLPILIYKFLLKVFGGETYLPFRLLAAFDMVAMAFVLGLVCRARWGRWWGLVPVLLLVTLGSGAFSLLWSFQVGYALADAAGFLALIALARRWRYGDLVACVALIVALASGSQGVTFLVGAAVLIALRGGWRRSTWAVVLPAVLYGLWYAKYGHQGSETDLSLWHDSLPYAMKAFATTLSGLLALGSPNSALPPQLDPSFGIPLALALLAGLAFLLWRGRRPPPLFWALLATLLALWLAASLSNIVNIRRPTDSRYLATNAMLLMGCICTLVPPPRLPRGGILVAGIALAVICATNAGQFTPVRDQMLATSVASRAELGALLIMRGVVHPDFSPVPPFTTGLINDVQAGVFFSGYDAYGGIIADSPQQLLAQDEGTRELTDGVLQRGEEIGYSFTTQPGPPAARHCVTLGASRLAELLRPGTYSFRAARRAPLDASLRRFAARYTVVLGVVPRGRTATVHIPADRAPHIPWQLQLSGRGQLCFAA